MSDVLHIRLKKISPTEHIFEYDISGNFKETLTLNTKTFLFHDLLHFAMESEAQLKNSFYGLLAKNRNYSALQDENIVENSESEVAMTERIVGALTGAIKSDISFENIFTTLENMLGAYSLSVPSWFTEEFFLRVQERMRRLLGAWAGTPFGTTMELTFEV